MNSTTARIVKLSRLRAGDADMDEYIRSQLKVLLSQPDRDELLDDPRRLAELVRERLGFAHKREAAFLNTVMQEGLPKRLLAMSGTSLSPNAVQTHVRSLSDSTGLQEVIARWAVETWLHGLGFTVATSDGAPEQKPAAEEWEANEAGHVRKELESRPREEEQRQGPQQTSRPWRQQPVLAALVAAAVIIPAAIGVWRLMVPPAPLPIDVNPSPPQPAPKPPQATPASPPAQRPQITVTPLLSPREQALQPKDMFRECSKCPQMIVVPTGKFAMGSEASEPGRAVDESPRHTVTIGHLFAVAQFDVTFDEWDACVADGGCGGNNPSDQGWGRGRRPVINVSWDDAKAYVLWLSKLTGKTYRLLTEAEYEYTARAGTTTPYPWGNAVGTNNANCAGCGSQWDGKQTAPVGSFAPNAFGLYDMVGNVWQWAEDCYHPSFDGAPADGSAWTTGECKHHVVRGGSWNGTPDCIRTANRYNCTDVNPGGTRGFRVARTLTL